MVACLGAEGKGAADANMVRPRDARIDMESKYKSAKANVTIFQNYRSELAQDPELLYQAGRIEQSRAKAAECALLNFQDRLTSFSSSVNVGKQFLEGRPERNLLSAVVGQIRSETKSFQMNMRNDIYWASMKLREGFRSVQGFPGERLQPFRNTKDLSNSGADRIPSKDKAVGSSSIHS